MSLKDGFLFLLKHISDKDKKATVYILCSIVALHWIHSVIKSVFMLKLTVLYVIGSSYCSWQIANVIELKKQVFS